MYFFEDGSHLSKTNDVCETVATLAIAGFEPGDFSDAGVTASPGTRPGSYCENSWLTTWRWSAKRNTFPRPPKKPTI